MRKEAKNSKWFIGIVVISIIAIVLSVMLIYDFLNPISTKELSKSAALKYSKLADEALGAKTKVTAKYLDVDGNTLSEDYSIEGVVGDEYIIPSKKISGYKLVGDEPYAKSGNFQNRDVEVEFVYKESNENVDITDGENNDVIVRMKSQKLVSEYNLKIITKDDTDNLVKGIAYEVTKNEDLMRSGVVQGNTFVVGTITVNKEGEDIFKISENPGDYFETLVDGDIQFSIKKVWNAEKGEYDVSVDYDRSLKGVKIEINGTDIIVTITNKAIITEEKGGDPDPKPDPEPEPELTPEPQKTFDLSITKYISKVVIDNGNGQKVIDRNIDNKNSLLKIEIASKEIEKTKVNITYNLLIKNIGEIPGYATEVTDYVPNNFELIDSEEWMKAEKTAITNSLSNKLLNPGEEVEIPVSFEWKLNDHNTGLRKNQAQITIYANDENIKDITPDNIDSAEIIVTVKTGLARTLGLGTLITLIIFACVIYKEKINNER